VVQEEISDHEEDIVLNVVRTARDTMQPALNVEKNAKYHSHQTKTRKYIAKNAI